jgi:hypothetical protein
MRIGMITREKPMIKAGLEKTRYSILTQNGTSSE